MSDKIRFRPEQVAASAFLADTCRLIGDVTVGEESSIWFQAVLRGDTESIRIGKQANIQDGCVLHADPGQPCIIGDRVTVGHSAIVHGATVERDSLIGIRAVILNGAIIGTGSLVAAGTLVTEGTEIPPASLVRGVPGRVVGRVPPRLVARIEHAADHYVELSRSYIGTEFDARR
jgi:carbonic anhydrase/acetyltransferase-like protein (isoleucine patch superfamily)